MTRQSDALAAIWREIATPSLASEAPYLRLMLAIAHACLGAALMEISAVAGLSAAAARGFVPATYWLVKERADLRRGGSLRDGLTDAAFVASGALSGAAYWHLGILAAALAVAVTIRPAR